MSTQTDTRVFTTADELPSLGLVYKRIRHHGESSSDTPLLTFVGGGGRSQIIKAEFATRPQDWWSQARDFFIEVVPTSSGDSFAGPLDDDDHPLPESAKRVRTLRKLSGLTWDQLARIFGVSRRSVHSWAQGGRMNARNTERLAEVESVLDTHFHDDPYTTRDALLKGVDGDPSPFQRLLRTAHDRSPRRAPDPITMLTSSGDGEPLPPEKHWYGNIVWPEPSEPSDQQTTER